jgi:hypothetical protein
VTTTIRHAITDLVLIPALFGFFFARGWCSGDGIEVPDSSQRAYHALGDACGQRLGAGRLMRVRLDSFIATTVKESPRRT